MKTWIEQVLEQVDPEASRKAEMFKGVLGQFRGLRYNPG